MQLSDEMSTSPVFAGEILDDGSSMRVSFAGELDVVTVEIMRALFRQPDVVNASAVHVDLTHTTFVDSSAIGVLVTACKRARDSHGVFSVTCGTASVRRSIEIWGLLEYLQVEGRA